MRVSLKSVSGVDSVDVSLTKGLASVKMKSDNSTTLKQLQDAITKNGFTMRDSVVIVAGTIVVANGKPQLKVSGSNELLTLVPESESSSGAASLNGKSVLVGGTIPETPRGKVPNLIRYRSIEEEQPK